MDPAARLPSSTPALICDEAQALASSTPPAREYLVNKTELIDAIANDSGLSRADSARSLDSLITTVQKTLKKGDDVAITGFGKFSVAKRGARSGRNPATGAAIKIKASKAPKFTAGQTLKTAVSPKKT